MDTNFTPFDLHRMFIGEAPPLYLLEIVFRTTFLYLATIILLRLISKRGMSNLSPFELVIIIALGSAVGDPMFYPSIPLLYAVVILIVIITLYTGIANLVKRYDFVETFIEGRPTLLVNQGELMEDALNKEKLNKAELFMKLRLGGIDDLGQVKKAYLESNGDISVFKFQTQDVVRQMSILPETKS